MPAFSAPDTFRFLEREPSVSASAFIAPGATVLGAVSLGKNSSVWYGAVLRADIQEISVGEGSNIQDGCVVHLSDTLGCHIGRYVTCGHRAVLHACTIGDEVLIGMGAVVLDGAQIGSRSIVGAGALVTGHSVIPPGSLVLGSPAKVVRTLSEEEQADVRSWAERYVEASRRFLERTPGRWG